MGAMLTWISRRKHRNDTCMAQWTGKHYEYRGVIKATVRCLRFVVVLSLGCVVVLIPEGAEV